MVEYAKRHQNGVLSGPFYTFGKEARDAFNLPYDEGIFRDALNSLQRVKALKRYNHAGVQTHYQLSAMLFHSMMAETDDGKRKYETFPVDGFISSVASMASAAAQIFPSARRTTLLEAYADLGSDYLDQILESMEPQLRDIDESDNEYDATEIPGPVDGFVGEEDYIPASDRIVKISDNQRVIIESCSDELIDEFSKENSVDGDPSLKDQFLGQLKAGRELIRATSFRLYLIRETWFSLLGSLVERYKDQAIGQIARKLLDLLVEYVVGK